MHKVVIKISLHTYLQYSLRGNKYYHSMQFNGREPPRDLQITAYK